MEETSTAEQKGIPNHGTFARSRVGLQLFCTNFLPAISTVIELKAPSLWGEAG